LAGSPAWARSGHKGGSGPAHSPAALGLLDQARAALSAKDYAAARTALTTAFRQSPGADVLFQLGAVAAAEGQTVAAHDLMRRYLHDTAGEGDNPDQKEAQRISEQDSQPAGEVNVLGARGAIVFIDDKLVGALPLALPLLLPLGLHKVTVELGAQRVEEQIKVLSGQLAEMRVNQRTGVVVVSLPPAIVLVPQESISAPLQKALATALREATPKDRYAVVTREQALAQKPSLATCLDKPSCPLPPSHRRAVSCCRRRVVL
jgi:hypothetical protein